MSQHEFHALASAKYFNELDAANSNGSGSNSAVGNHVAARKSGALNRVGTVFNFLVLFGIVASLGAWYRVNSPAIYKEIAKFQKASKHPMNVLLFMNGSSKTFEEMLLDTPSTSEFSSKSW